MNCLQSYLLIKDGVLIMGPPGHFAIGFAAKPTAPEVPIWVFLLASWFLDLLSYAFQSLGLEDFGVADISLEFGIRMVVPASVALSHGLTMSIVWSIVFGAVAFIFFRDRLISLILGLVVFSHWILDFIVHIPDLPLFLEGSPLLGLGMWGSGLGLIASGILEIVLLTGGLAIYFVYRKRNQPQVSKEKK
jgi:hypothetical protein